MKFALPLFSSETAYELKQTSEEIPSPCSKIWIIVALVVVFFLALPNLRYPIYRDQATFLVIAQGLLHGKMLYRDLWDNKPPGVFYLYVPIVKIFGRAMWSVAVVDILWLLAMSACIFSFARRYLGPPAAFIATITFAIWHCQADYVNAAQADGFLILFIFIAYFLLVRPGRFRLLRHALAGLALGAAFWMKYNAVVFLPFLLSLPYLDFSRLDESPRRLKLKISWRAWLTGSLTLIAAFAVEVLAVLAYFWLEGIWPYMKQVELEVLPRYGMMAMESKPHYWLWVILISTGLIGMFTVPAMILVPILAWKRRHLHMVVPVLWAALSGYMCAASQLSFRSYTVVAVTPFLAMGWGYLAVRAFEGIRSLARSFSSAGGKFPRLIIWMAFASLLLLIITKVAIFGAERYQAFAAWRENPEHSYMYYRWPMKLMHHPSVFGAIRYLKKVAKPGDGLFVWGNEPLLYFATGLQPPTRFISNLPLMAAWGPPEWRNELMRSLRKRPPLFITVDRGSTPFSTSYIHLDSEQYLAHFPALNGFLSKNYVRVKNFPYMAIYRRTHN